MWGSWSKEGLYGEPHTVSAWMAVYKVSLLTDTEGRPLGRTLKPGLSSGIKAVELCEGLFAPLPLISAAFSLPKPGHCGGGGWGCTASMAPRPAGVGFRTQTVWPGRATPVQCEL